MAAAQDLLEHKINLQTRADGAMILTSGYALGPVAANTGEWLHTWAKDAPDRVFLAERIDDSWREVTYGQALTAVRSLAAGLLGMGLAPGDRVAILSGNSVDHGLLALATQYVGIVSAPVAEQYSLIPEARDRLAYIIDMLKPKLLFVDDPARYAAALDVEETRAIPVLASTLEGSPRAATLFADLMAFPVSGDVDIAHAGVGPDTLAKVLFTSGSTAHPKGVCTTQRMMCVNQAQLAASMPFLTWQVPKILDWLPWNHVFGGS
ncbi:MAG: AMP-binding protein, partial [Rhodobacteraceae bacterium]|nr:AMP-binding protein [Paracoccaceae bacterium]